jgi:hypothetical protein
MLLHKSHAKDKQKGEGIISLLYPNMNEALRIGAKQHVQSKSRMDGADVLSIAIVVHTYATGIQ